MLLEEATEARGACTDLRPSVEVWLCHCAVLVEVGSALWVGPHATALLAMGFPVPSHSQSQKVSYGVIIPFCCEDRGSCKIVV